jgi:hypothetical protein
MSGVMVGEQNKICEEVVMRGVENLALKKRGFTHKKMKNAPRVKMNTVTPFPIALPNMLPTIGHISLAENK